MSAAHCDRQFLYSRNNHKIFNVNGGPQLLKPLADCVKKIIQTYKIATREKIIRVIPLVMSSDY